MLSVLFKLYAKDKNAIKSNVAVNFFAYLASKAEALLPLRKQRNFLYAASLLFFPTALLAQSHIEQQIQQQVQREINQYLQQLGVRAQKQEITVNVAGAASRMSQCAALHISRRQPQDPPLGRLSYQLSCNDPEASWQGRAVVQSRVWLNLVLASRTLERDEIVQADMLQLASTEISQVRHGLEFNPQALLGLSVRRRITAGQVVGRHLLSQNFLVNNGAIITIAVNLDGFSASTQGTALENGQLGQRIKVRNNSSGIIIEALVTAENQVETQAKRN